MTPSKRIKNFLSPEGLSARLTTLILIAAIPLAGLMFYDQITSRRRIARQTLDNARRLASLIFENYHMTAEGARQLLTVLAQTPRAAPGDGACTDFLSSLLRQYPQYLNLGVIDLEGRVRCSAMPVPPGTRLGDRIYFLKAIQTRDFSVGEFQIGRITGKASVNFGHPIFDGTGHLQGVLFAALDLSRFHQLAKSAELPAEAIIAVFDRNGTILARFPDPDKWLGKKMPEAPLLQAAETLNVTDVEASGPDGAIRLYALMPLQGRTENGVYLTVGLPKKASFQAIERLLVRDMAILAFLMFMLLIVVQWPADRLILRPVRALVEATAKLGAGDLSVRTGLSEGHTGELGQLAQSFDRMAESLQQRDTLKRKAEASLQENRRFLATLLSNLPGMAYRLRKDGGKWLMEFVSEGCGPLTGYSSEELTEDVSVSYPELIHHDDLDPLTKEVKAAAEARRPYQYTYRIKAKDGSEKWVWEQGRGVLSPDGEELYREGFIADITEQKKIESQFLRTQRMESLGTLAGGIAHDLNNVLAPILMAIPILERSVQDPQAKEFLNLVAGSAKRGVDMVRQVLTFSRGSQGGRTPLHVGSLIKEMQKIVSETFPKNIQVKSRVQAEGLSAILGDPTHVHQVLLNLCVNARDAMPKGGTITLSAENAQVDQPQADRIPGAKIGSYVLVKVTDTGTGIPPEVLPKIFDPFFTTKEPGKGTGIGLSTVAGIMKGHGGFMSIDTEIGHGTCFDLYFPTAVESEAQPDETAAPQFPPGNGEMVLVVDDEAAVREITKATLQAHNYRVTVAQDGAEALALYAQHSTGSVDIVILDLAMPVMDGAQTLRALKRINPQAKVVLTSGMTPPAELCTRDGKLLQPFLPKPFSPENLLAFLRQALHETASQS